MLRFNKISKKFANHWALTDITFEIGKGEFVFLVGPSGAGKTTVLRLIIKDILPTHGSIKLNDIDIISLPPSRLPILRRKIGMVFQDFKILFDRTVFENVAVALEILGKHNREIRERVKEVLEQVGLSDKENLFPVQLSAGELQRTAIARAIAPSPNILLADEPTGNLDPKIGWDILDVLGRINRSGTTILMATHNVDIVNSLDKRVIRLKNGKVLKDEKKGRYT